MFERYTERARRIIFFARYEASQFGSPYIETEHILLGLMREDKALSSRFLLKGTSAGAIRRKIEDAAPKREKTSTSVDLPVSNEGKRVLSYAAEEADRLNERHIGSEHLLVALLREEQSFAAVILRDSGLRLNSLRDELARIAAEPAEKTGLKPGLPLLRNDLTNSVIQDKLHRFVGREKEMERLIQVLGRATKNNALLIGEPGTGKRAMVEGLAQRIAENNVPVFLSDRKILDCDIAQIGGPLHAEAVELLRSEAANLFLMEELFPLLAVSAPEKLPASAETLKSLLLNGSIQCLCSATQEEWRKSLEQHGWLERCFCKIEIAAMTPKETTAVLLSVQKRVQAFHSVVFSQEAIAHAAGYASAFVHNRSLPEAAVDLIDEAAAHAKTRKQIQPPPEVREARERLRSLVQAMQAFIARRDFEKAKEMSDDERKQREQLQELEKQHKLGEPIPVTLDDVEQVLSHWTGIPDPPDPKSTASSRQWLRSLKPGVGFQSNCALLDCDVNIFQRGKDCIGRCELLSWKSRSQRDRTHTCSPGRFNSRRSVFKDNAIRRR